MMKIIFTILFLSVFAFGQNTSDVNMKPDFKKKNACDVLSNEYLANSLNWNASVIKKEETKFRRASVCTINQGEENMLIRLGWKSDAAKKNKVLEKQFEKFLKVGEKGMKYEEVVNKDDRQILYGSGQEKFGFTTYIARKRFGSDSMIQLEIRTQNPDETVLREKVLEMVDKIK